MTISLCAVRRIPAAAISSSAMNGAAGCWAAIWSWTMLRAQVSRSSSGRIWVGSLSIPRKV